MQRAPAALRQWKLCLCLWPGLAQLWVRGSWLGLALAVGFAVLVNLALVTSLVWTEMVGHPAQIACWATAAAIWCISGLTSYWWFVRQAGWAPADSGGDLFPLALGEYLRGNWYEAEKLARRMIRRDRRDAEARLLWATLLRHTRRLDEARACLTELKRLESAQRWTWEIERETERIERAAAAQASPVESAAAESPAERAAPDLVDAA